MKLYVVQGNIYLESYGDYRNIFRVELNTPINEPIGGYAE